MAVRLKTCSHLMVRLGAIKTNAISCWGFSTSPQAPTWEEGGQLPSHDCVHLKLHNCRAEVQQPPM